MQRQDELASAARNPSVTDEAVQVNFEADSARSGLKSPTSVRSKQSNTLSDTAIVRSKLYDQSVRLWKRVIPAYVDVSLQSTSQATYQDFSGMDPIDPEHFHKRDTFSEVQAVFYLSYY